MRKLIDFSFLLFKGVIIIKVKWIENVGKEIKQERLSWGMSRGKLARLSHIDKETIKEIETGQIIPNFFDMLNICEVLGSSVYFYLNDDKRG